MSSLRTWLALALAIAVAAGLFVIDRLQLYSQMPAYQDRVAFALRILAYNRLSCQQAYLFDYSQGSITLQCRDRDATRFEVYAIEPCSETLGCRWFPVLCWYATSPA